MLLDNLHHKRPGRRRRESTWDRSGGPRDLVELGPAQSIMVPELRGPGIIRHLWVVLGGDHFPDSDIYRAVRLVLRFDGAAEPQVDVPLADFFLFGHGHLVDVNSLPIQVSRSFRRAEPPYLGALNCTFPMPFDGSAEISLHNTSAHAGPFKVYYYVDWDQHAEPLPEAHPPFPRQLQRGAYAAARRCAGLPHAGRRRELLVPARGRVRGPLRRHRVERTLPATRRPRRRPRPRPLVGGDDWFVIDGERWPPTLHGTGTEDYFNLAYGFHRVDCRPEYGVTFLERPDPILIACGKFSMYRFHLSDPIPFERSLAASLEHGNFNLARVHYRSVAYWYGRPTDL